MNGLYAHQEAELRFLQRIPRALLLSDMGTGKTPVLIRYAAAVLADGGRVLWLTELGLASQLVAESRTWLAAGLPQPKDYTGKTDYRDRFFYTTHKTAASRFKQWGARYDLLIVDEAALFASASNGSQGKHTFQAMQELTDRSERSVFATGTPVQTAHGLDLLALLEAARIPNTPARSQYLQELDFMTIPLSGGHTEPLPRSVSAEGVAMFAEALSTAAVRTRLQDVNARANIPELVRAEIPVELTGQNLTDYLASSEQRGLSRHQSQTRASRSVDDLVPAAINYLTRGDGAQHSHSVVFSEFFDVYEPLKAALQVIQMPVFEINGTMNARQRDASIQAHRESRRGVLLGTGALENGLNLQHASLLLSVDDTWNATRERQREARLVRPESPHEVVYHATIAPAVDLAARKAGRRDEKEALAEQVLAFVPNPLDLKVRI